MVLGGWVGVRGGARVRARGWGEVRARARARVRARGGLRGEGWEIVIGGVKVSGGLEIGVVGPRLVRVRCGLMVGVGLG